MAGIDWWFALESRFSGLIPQINVLMGPCIAGQAYCPTLCDFLFMSRKTSNLWLGGPRMTDNVGGADYHMTYSGTCDVIGDDDAQTIAKARELLDYLPNNCRETPPEIPSADDPDRKVEELAQIIPDEIEIMNMQLN
jgi:propionyl-CoA carboxylase beta chain